MSSQDKIKNVCDGIKKVLLEKNKRYGNSALDPLTIFSKFNSDESICIRLDDKLSRVNNSDKLRKNDVFDILGYLVLLCIAKGWNSFEDLID